MRELTLKLYSFNELSEKAKQKAIQDKRETYYRHELAEWAVDNCYLFEPDHQEMIDLFGDNYNFILIKNTRKNIYFSTDRDWYLDCAKAMEITDRDKFLLWLGVDTSIEGLNEIEFNVFTLPYRGSSTTISFGDYSSDFNDLILDATEKFNDHIHNILKRIENDIDYRFTDEAIIEELSNDDCEYLEDGKQY